ncbi:hypothetical protein [Streptomyces fodineus]|uniref:hypothetical protein n=1 Tax=Streptomyces fodineus TaxID=1904616 RepID=UPI00131C8E60
MPLTTAPVGPTETASGRTAALSGCAGVVVLFTRLVLPVPDVRTLPRHTRPVAASSSTPSDTERPVRRLGRRHRPASSTGLP